MKCKKKLFSTKFVYVLRILIWKKKTKQMENFPKNGNIKNQRNFIQKKLLKGYSKIHELKLVTIGLASPEKIKSWAEKELPNGKIFGEVTNANTFHYRTFKPSKGGLFCERIFGPIKDFECACGKRQKPTALESKKILEHEQTTRYFCPNCDVEYTWSIIRRYQLGYIKFNAPVTHLWYLKTNPSYLSILFDMKRKHLESIIYCTESITLENMWKSVEKNAKLNPSPTELYKNWQKLFSIEQNMQKYYRKNAIHKKIKKQKKRVFREKCLKKGMIFQKVNWGFFNSENFKTDMENNKNLVNSQSLPYFESLSQKKTNIFLNIQKQKQKQFFSNIFHNIWKMILTKMYKKAINQIDFQIYFLKNTFFPYSVLNFQNFEKNKRFQTMNEIQKNEQHLSKDEQHSFKMALYAENFDAQQQFLGRMKFPVKICKFFYFNSFSNSISHNIQKNIGKILNLTNDFLQYDCISQNTPLSTYLQVLSNKNTKYLNLQNCLIFIESTEKTKLIFKSSMFGKNDQYIEHFWNSFYFLFESGIFFISQKTKKTNKKFISKKKLLFLINMVGFFHKIFVFKNTKFSKKKFQQIQSFLFAYFLRKKHFVSIETNEKSKVLQQNKFEQSLSFNAKDHKKNNLFIEKDSISFQFFKNFYDLPKNRKKMNFTVEPHSRILSQFDFFNNISNVEKILSNFQEYAKIEFSLIVQNQWFNELQTLSNPNFLKEKLSPSGFQNTSPFPFFISTFPQIPQYQTSSGIADFYFQNIELNQSKILKFFEKNIFEYFCLFLFFSTFQFLFPDFLFYNVKEKSRNLERNNVFEQNGFDHQIENQFKNIENKSFDENVPFLNFFNIFDISIQTKDHKILDDQTFLSFQKLLNLSFLFFSSDFFSEIQKKKVFHLFPVNSFLPNGDFLTDSHLATNSYSLLNDKVQKHLPKFTEINMKLSNDNLTIENFNTKVVFRKKLFKKMQQFQKTQFLPWQIQKEMVNSEVRNSKNQKKIVQSSIPMKVSKSLKLNQLNENNTFNNSNVIYTKEKPWIWNFSLFSKQKNKFQTPEISKAPFVSYGKQGNGLFQGSSSSFLKNFVYTIAYNFLWNNDSDWKYFVYYNSFFVHKFEDIPIFEYSSFSKTKNGLLLSPGTSFSNLDDSFLSFLSFQIDSFQKNFLIGAGILEKLLTEYNSFELKKMTKQHQILLPKINQTIRFLKQTTKTKKDVLKIQKYFQKREHIIRRLKFLRKFFRRNSNPNFMILRNLPVLPPDLRPILKLQNQIAASDLNRFYQRIIYRNDRLKKFSKDSATNQSFEIQYAQRLLQEAVDNLIQNGKGGVKPETNSRGQALKSLSEILKGKQGRFRQYLLGKRVDYSGRSVIVVGPQLKLYECGLPKEMAFELFLPFLIQYILHSKLAKTVIGAKNLLKTNSTFTFHLLHKVLQNIPVLLNRAPTLHRLGFQAFLPKLIEGRAILLHPMVCPAFNADFDGDQMAVHIPLTVEARTEAWKFMLATNNLMNSATGEPILLPSQDMVLGCYYLTLDYYSKSFATQFLNVLRKQNISGSETIENISSSKAPSETFVQNGFFKNFSQKKIQKFQYFIRQHKSFLLYNNFHEILATYQKKEINLHTAVWVKWNAPVNFGNDYFKPVEIRLQKNGYWQLIQPKYTTFYNQKNHKFSQFIRTTTGRIFMNLMIQKSMY